MAKTVAYIWDKNLKLTEIKDPELVWREHKDFDVKGYHTIKGHEGQVLDSLLTYVKINPKKISDSMYIAPHSGIPFGMRGNDDGTGPTTVEQGNITGDPSIAVIWGNRRYIDLNRDTPPIEEAKKYALARDKYLNAKNNFTLIRDKYFNRDPDVERTDVKEAKDNIWKTHKELLRYRMRYAFPAHDEKEYKIKQEIIRKFYNEVRKHLTKDHSHALMVHSYGPSIDPKFNGLIIPLNTSVGVEDMEKVELISEILNKKYGHLAKQMVDLVDKDVIQAREHVLQNFADDQKLDLLTMDFQNEKFIRGDLRVLGLKEKYESGKLTKKDFFKKLKDHVKKISEGIKIFSTSEPFNEYAVVDPRTQLLSYGNQTEIKSKNFGTIKSFSLEAAREILRNNKKKINGATAFKHTNDMIADFSNLFKRDHTELIKINKFGPEKLRETRFLK